jgi:hypothetical protein
LENKRWFTLVLLASICVTYYGENFLKAAASALSPVLIKELGINGDTIGFSIITPFYGGLIDSTGSYFASNVVIIAISLIVTATMIFFTKGIYGGLKKTN